MGKPGCHPAKKIKNNIAKRSKAVFHIITEYVK
jgi:hypothetical protein